MRISDKIELLEKTLSIAENEIASLEEEARKLNASYQEEEKATFLINLAEINDEKALIMKAMREIRAELEDLRCEKAEDDSANRRAFVQEMERKGQ